MQDLNNISLSKRTLSMTNLTGSSTSSASPEYKSHFNHNDSSSYANSSANGSPFTVPSEKGVYSREVLMNKTVDELPEGVDPTKKEVTALLVLCPRSLTRNLVVGYMWQHIRLFSPTSGSERCQLDAKVS